MKYLYTQTDDSWKNDIMTQKKGVWIDKIGRWGCLITCLAIVLSEIFNKRITPKQVNKVVRRIKAYLYLDDKNTPENQASILIWHKIKKYYDRLIEFNLFEDIECYHKIAGKYHIAIIEHEITGKDHFVVILDKWKDYFICHDVEDGQIKIMHQDKIINIHQAVKK
jgi:hypothetical protein